MIGGLKHKEARVKSPPRFQNDGARIIGALLSLVVAAFFWSR
jgi:hypothetical protein